MNATRLAVGCVATVAFLSPLRTQAQIAEPAASGPSDVENPEVIAIVELSGTCERCPDDRQTEVKPLSKDDHLHAMDDVRCYINSYAIGEFFATRKKTQFTGLAWSPVGFPAPNDPTLHNNSRAGRVSYDNIDEARNAAYASLGLKNGQETVAGYPDHRMIAARVKQAIIDTPGLDVSNLNVHIRNGKVVLTGTVDEPSDKYQATKVARVVTPGYSVKNNLQIKPTSAASGVGTSDHGQSQ